MMHEVSQLVKKVATTLTDGVDLTAGISSDAGYSVKHVTGVCREAARIFEIKFQATAVQAAAQDIAARTKQLRECEDYDKDLYNEALALLTPAQ